jgi:pimeloyl-ACP methyl ester carboxylesterase
MKSKTAWAPSQAISVNLGGGWRPTSKSRDQRVKSGHGRFIRRKPATPGTRAILSLRAGPIMTLAAVFGALLCCAAAQARPDAGGITWGPCSDPNLQAFNAQCGFLSVPLDYSNPSGPQIQLAVSRILHTSSSTDYQGVIVANPGGPGQSGLDLNASLVSALQGEGYTAAAADYDWIGFDPRGVGSSQPAISCNPNYFSPDRPSYVPTSPALTRYWLGQSEAYAQACDDVSVQQSALLRHMTTRDTAMDLDRIRQALGQTRITYYGFSYGTYIGQVYATMFPTHVRRLILDSSVNPTRIGYDTFNLDQDAPVNRNIDLWFRWVATHNSVYQLGTSEAAVKNLFYSTEAALTSNPAGGEIGPDEWTDIFVVAALTNQVWDSKAQAFAVWVHRHSAALLIKMYEGDDSPGYDNGYAAFLAVECTDSPWPTNWGQWERDVWTMYARAPFGAWGNAWFDAPCIFWAAPASQPFNVNGNGISSALLIDETLDAVTPYSGSLVVRSLLPHAVLLAEPGGTSHASSLSGDTCVDGTIAAYLTTGVLPARKPGPGPDTTCAPLPPPDPSPDPAVQQLGERRSQLDGQPLPFDVPASELR